MDKFTKQAKLEMFVNDALMFRAVYEVLLETFLGKKGDRDVQTLAAERLSVDFLRDAWKKIESYKELNRDEPVKEAGHL